MNDKDPKEGRAAQVEAPSKPLTKARFAASRAAGIAVALVAGAALATAALLPASQDADQRAASLEEQLASERASHPEGAAQAACDHTWRTLGLFEETSAITHTEEYPEVTEVVDVPHTVCNTCMAIVDGATAEHSEATGHTGFSTDVPIPTTVVTQAAYSEEVVDSPAEQRFTPVLEWCPACGATQVASDPLDEGHEPGAVETDEETAALLD